MARQPAVSEDAGASAAAVALAKRVEHPLSLASALFLAGAVHIQRGELDRMRERTGKLVGLAEVLAITS